MLLDSVKNNVMKIYYFNNEAASVLTSDSCVQVSRIGLLLGLKMVAVK
jgi:hypothetical protein